MAWPAIVQRDQSVVGTHHLVVPCPIVTTLLKAAGSRLDDLLGRACQELAPDLSYGLAGKKSRMSAKTAGPLPADTRLKAWVVPEKLTIGASVTGMFTVSQAKLDV